MEEYYLGFETSCDDTSCAVYSTTRRVVAHGTAAQLDHRKYGGVVPEIASRSHMKAILPLYEQIMDQAGTEPGSLAGMGVTNGPGLTGSLLVGLSFAKALAYGTGVPLAGIHHLEGHILANDLEEDLITPAIVLVVSGGHTQLINAEKVGIYHFLGGTRDDAAGEAFDKIGKMLGLPYPGGPAIEKKAREGDPGAFDFPRGLRHSGKCDFSFSGLKTAVRLKIEELLPLTEQLICDIAASAQEAIVTILVEKSLLALHRYGGERFYLAGGVAANGRLRELMDEKISQCGVKVSWPPPLYCTDNAAMIACAASYHIRQGRVDGLDLNSFPRGNLKSWMPLSERE